jgi:hypothetical protein
MTVVYMPALLRIMPGVGVIQLRMHVSSQHDVYLKLSDISLTLAKYRESKRIARRPGIWRIHGSFTSLVHS